MTQQRANLKAARKEKGLTQQAVADRIGVSIRYYKAMESGERLGAIDLWDALENLLGIHQRVLREIRPCKEDNQLRRQDDLQSSPA